MWHRRIVGKKGFSEICAHVRNGTQFRGFSANRTALLSFVGGSISQNAEKCSGYNQWQFLRQCRSILAQPASYLRGSRPMGRTKGSKHLHDIQSTLACWIRVMQSPLSRMRPTFRRVSLLRWICENGNVRKRSEPASQQHGL
jgi:hypothetical protein